MWNGKMKAITFSYDDGVEQDRRLVEIFNQYGLKGTFNLNSGIQTGASFWKDNNVLIRRMNRKDLRDLYQGHEIAVHTLTHPNPAELDDETVYNEIMQDKLNLEAFHGYKIEGMAYPYGVYDDRIANIAKECGIKYSRTVCETNHFDNYKASLIFHPTCHHQNPKLFELAESFLSMKPDKPQLFYIWGHSYEFDVNDNWSLIEDFCRLVSGREDIYYGTNSEVLLNN